MVAQMHSDCSRDWASVPLLNIDEKKVCAVSLLIASHVKDQNEKQHNLNPCII